MSADNPTPTPIPFSTGLVNLRFFESVPKLSSHDDYAPWNSKILMAFAFSNIDDFLDPEALTPTADELVLFRRRDHSLAAAILLTLEKDVAEDYKSCIQPINSKVLFRSRTLFTALVTRFGGSGSQYTYSLGRKLLDSVCGDGDDVEAWMKEVSGYYRELKELEWGLDSLFINVLLHGLPSRFAPIFNQVWIGSVDPSVEEIKLAISRLNTGLNDRAGGNKALAARDAEDSPSDLTAFYAGERKRGKKPSKDHPCARCGSAEHWVPECPEPPRGEWRGKGGGKGKGGKGGGGKGSGNGGSSKSAEAKDEEVARVAATAAPAMTAERASALVASGVTTFSEDVDVAFIACEVIESTVTTSANCLVARDDSVT